MNIQADMYRRVTGVSCRADPDCRLREASSQRIPRLTVKVQQSAPNAANTFLIPAALLSTSAGIQ